MNHLGTKPLSSERLLLRRFTLSDADAMYTNWAKDPEVTKYLTWPTHESVETSKAVLEDWTKHYNELDYYQWAIVLKENGDEPIGSIAVVRKDDRIAMVHIGYCIGRQWWHQRIVSEALQTVIDFFISEVGANRVEARHDPNNPNSGRVMMKCGMKYEGTMKYADYNNQGICDFSMYAILASEYAGIK